MTLHMAVSETYSPLGSRTRTIPFPCVENLLEVGGPDVPAVYLMETVEIWLVGGLITFDIF